MTSMQPEHEPASPATVVTPALGQSSLGTRAARGSLWLALSALVSKGGISVVLLVLAAVLSPSELGVLAIGTLVVNVAMNIQDLGFTDVLTYQKDRAEAAARTALTVMLVTGGLSTLLVVGLSPLIAEFFDAPESRGVIVGLGSVLVCYAVAMVPLGMMTRTLSFGRRSVPLTVPGLVGGAITVVLAVSGYGVTSLVVGQVVAGVLTAALAFAVGPRVRPGWDGALAREMLGYGRHLFGAGLVGLVQLNIDYILVGKFLSTAALGVYSLAFRLAFLPYFAVAQVINGAAFPLYCRLGSPAEVGRALVRVTGVIVLVTLPLVTGLVVFAPSITLLGDKWLPAVGVVRWLGVFVLLYSLEQSAQVALKAVGRPGRLFAASALHLGLLSVAVAVAVQFAVVWVGVAQAGVALVVLLISWRWARQAIPIDLRALWRACRVPLLATLAMAMVGFGTAALPSLEDPAAWLQAVPRALLALLAYAGVVVAFDRGALTDIRATVKGG